MEQKCADVVRENYKSRISDLRKILDAEYKGEPDPELGEFNEYGLSFNYVAPGTFSDQRRGYFRYQLSCGGPQEEFRFYLDERLQPTRIEFWYLDWFDGAKVVCTNNQTVRDIWYWFECCDLRHMIEEAD